MTYKERLNKIMADDYQVYTKLQLESFARLMAEALDEIIERLPDKQCECPPITKYMKGSSWECPVHGRIEL
jgi:hypothetical protein